MHKFGMKATLVALAAAATTVTAAQAADFTVSVYGGYQTAPHSDVVGTDPTGVGDFSFFAGWEGKSTAMPPYYGIRGTWWTRDNFGWVFDYSHAKVYADEETLADSGFEVLEFTDGLNTVNFGPMWRWPTAWGKFTPYAGAGVGFTVPHVEVKSNAAANETHEFQFGGLSVSAVAGVSYELNERWDMFTEYKGTYNQVRVDLDGGGNLETDVITNALNFGVTYKF